MSRDLDAKIAEGIFKWRLIPVGKDYDGENDCMVLFYPDKEPTPDYYEFMPRKGVVHKGFFTPKYSSDLIKAIELAKYVNIPMTVKEMPMDAEKLAQKCLDFWIANQNALSEN